MKISGIGIDIIEVKRIKRIAQKNKRFLTRVFTPQEIEYCSKKKNKWPHFAVRFAAKEAIWKALGRNGINLKDISVTNTPSGKPAAVLKGRMKKWEKNIYVSLSHCDDYALAQAILVK